MNSLKKNLLMGTVFVTVAGIISHFVYEWSGNNSLIGLFFPVNELTWEHMKLVFFPMLIYSLFGGSRLVKEYDWAVSFCLDFCCMKCKE